jgi:flagellin
VGKEFNQNSTYTFLVGTDYADSQTGTEPAQYETISFSTGGIDGAAAVNSVDQLTSAAQAFNDKAGRTGFSAEIVKSDSGGYALKLTNENGLDLRIINFSAATNADGKNLNVATTDISAIDGDTGTVAFLTDSLAAKAPAAGDTWADKKTGGSWITGRVTFDSEASFGITTAQDANIFHAGDGTAAKGTYGGKLQSTSAVDVSTYDSALRTLSIVDSALASINGQRARYGALQNRFENTITNLQTTSENLSASRSRIRDADFAEETAKLTRSQILQQAGIAMLSQANALPQQVLTLLR